MKSPCIQTTDTRAFPVGAEIVPQSGTTDKSATQAERIRAALVRGEKLTALGAMSHYGILRLAAVIHSLRRAGMSIASHKVPVQTRNGRVAHIAKYWMMPET